MAEPLDIFGDLPRVVTHATATLAGSWATTREPGAPHTILHASYKGILTSDLPFVGVLLLVEGGLVDWVKSPPPAPGAPLPAQVVFELLLRGWTNEDREATLIARLSGATRSSLAQHIAEPPGSCPIAEGPIEAGRPHVLFRLPNVTGALVLLSRADVEVHRNRLWSLREALARQLSPDLGRLLTRGRTGALGGDVRT